MVESDRFFGYAALWHSSREYFQVTRCERSGIPGGEEVRREIYRSSDYFRVLAKSVVAERGATELHCATADAAVEREHELRKARRKLGKRRAQRRLERKLGTAGGRRKRKDGGERKRVGRQRREDRPGEQRAGSAGRGNRSISRKRQERSGEIRERGKKSLEDAVRASGGPSVVVKAPMAASRGSRKPRLFASKRKTFGKKKIAVIKPPRLGKDELKSDRVTASTLEKFSGEVRKTFRRLLRKKIHGTPIAHIAGVPLSLFLRRLAKLERRKNKKLQKERPPKGKKSKRSLVGGKRKKGRGGHGPVLEAERVKKDRLPTSSTQRGKKSSIKFLGVPRWTNISSRRGCPPPLLRLARSFLLNKRSRADPYAARVVPPRFGSKNRRGIALYPWDCVAYHCITTGNWFEWVDTSRLGNLTLGGFRHEALNRGTWVRRPDAVLPAKFVYGDPDDRRRHDQPEKIRLSYGKNSERAGEEGMMMFIGVVMWFV